MLCRDLIRGSLIGKNPERLVAAGFEPEEHEEIARLADIEEIRENMHNLSIPLYVHNGTNDDGKSLESTIEAWQVGRVELKEPLIKSGASRLW